MRVVGIKGKMDYIDVYFEDGVVRMPGELIHGGFVVDKEEVKEWKEPEGKPVSEEELEEIIEAVTEKTKGSHMVIVFE